MRKSFSRLALYFGSFFGGTKFYTTLNMKNIKNFIYFYFFNLIFFFKRETTLFLV